MIEINTPVPLGKDCITLVFSINKSSNLIAECKDNIGRGLGSYDLGSIF